MKFLGKHAFVPSEHNFCRACGASLSHRKPWTKYCDRKCYRLYAPDSVLRVPKNPKERFECNVEYEPNTGCWLWNSTLNLYGYGTYYANNRPYMAHRYSYELYRGSIDEELVVRHTCDTPQCVNPSHLILGTQQDNIDDRQNRGRQKVAVGEDYGWPHTKLTEEQVLDIRSRVGQGQRSMAREFNVSQTCIRLILIGKNWKHLL